MTIKKPKQADISQRRTSAKAPIAPDDVFGYNPNISNAEWCSGSTGDFGSLSPGSNPGSAAPVVRGKRDGSRNKSWL